MSPRFAPGNRVRVQALYPPGHVRTPYYARGREGVVLAVAAIHANPEELAYGRPGLPAEPVYRVRLSHAELWNGRAGDATIADLRESWLQPVR